MYKRQHQDGERHGDQRVDEVAKSGVDDVVVQHTPHVDRPVHRHQDAGRAQPPEQGAVAQDVLEVTQLPPHQHSGEAEDEGPQHPMADDLEGSGSREQLEVERERAPQQVRREREQHPSGVEWWLLA